MPWSQLLIRLMASMTLTMGSIFSIWILKMTATATVHQWLVNATDGHTSEKPMDKRTCVRVRYAGQHHVDLPAYGELNGKYLLAVKGETKWPHSDPMALTDWFVGQVKSRGEQLRRIVRYLKAWADFKSNRGGKMPSGGDPDGAGSQSLSSRRNSCMSCRRQSAQTLGNAIMVQWYQNNRRLFREERKALAAACPLMMLSGSPPSGEKEHMGKIAY